MIHHSIIAATFNRSAKLERTLIDIQNLEIPPALAVEVIVVDNASTDGTKAMVETFIASSPLNVRYVFEKQQGPAYARNRGVREAHGEIVTFIDDDVLIPRRWLFEIHRAFENYNAACVGGRVMIDPSLKMPAWWDERWQFVLSSFDLGDEAIVSTEEHPLVQLLGTGGNLSCRKSALERHGGMRTDIGRFGSRAGGGEDSEFIWRLQRRGETVVYSPGAVLYHSPQVERYTRRSLRSFFYHYGQTVCQQDLISPVPSKRVAGVPGWRCKRLLTGALKAAWRGTTGGRREALFQGMNLIWTCGYLAAAATTRRSSFMAVKPPAV